MAEINNYPTAPDPRLVELGRAKSHAVASLVLGIVALVCSITGLGAVIGLVCGIIGLLLGGRARKILPPGENGMATAGWICSIIALCLCGIAILFVAGFLGLLGLAAYQ